MSKRANSKTKRRPVLEPVEVDPPEECREEEPSDAEVERVPPARREAGQLIGASLLAVFLLILFYFLVSLWLPS